MSTDMLPTERQIKEMFYFADDWQVQVLRAMLLRSRSRKDEIVRRMVLVGVNEAEAKRFVERTRGIQWHQIDAFLSQLEGHVKKQIIICGRGSGKTFRGFTVDDVIPPLMLEALIGRVSILPDYPVWFLKRPIIESEGEELCRELKK